MSEERVSCLPSYQRTCCSRAAAHVAQAIVLLKFVDGEAAEGLRAELRPYVKRTEGLKEWQQVTK